MWITLIFLLLVPVQARMEYWHHSVPQFIPPDLSRPCRHAFRDDPETSALLADFVIIGRWTPTHRSHPGILYNASIHVEQVLKRPMSSIYPVREGYPILAGLFSQWPDLGRCWIDLQPRKRYIFFIERPNWAGYFRISQLPLLYSNYRWRRIASILAKRRKSS